MPSRGRLRRAVLCRGGWTRRRRWKRQREGGRDGGEGDAQRKRKDRISYLRYETAGGARVRRGEAEEDVGRERESARRGRRRRGTQQQQQRQRRWRRPTVRMVTRRGDGHGGRESAGRGLGYHFSAVLPRKHVPGINELTISERLFSPPRMSERASDPFPPIYGGVRPKRSGVHEKANRGYTGGEVKPTTTFAVARSARIRDRKRDRRGDGRARSRGRGGARTCRLFPFEPARSTIAPSPGLDTAIASLAAWTRVLL